MGRGEGVKCLAAEVGAIEVCKTTVGSSAFISTLQLLHMDSTGLKSLNYRNDSRTERRCFRSSMSAMGSYAPCHSSCAIVVVVLSQLMTLRPN